MIQRQSGLVTTTVSTHPTDREDGGADAGAGLLNREQRVLADTGTRRTIPRETSQNLADWRRSHRISSTPHPWYAEIGSPPSPMTVPAKATRGRQRRRKRQQIAPSRTPDRLCSSIKTDEMRSFGSASRAERAPSYLRLHKASASGGTDASVRISTRH